MSNSAITGRKKEQAKINEILTSGMPEFLVVYGRRRVGKTYLIRQFLQEKMVFDFTGTYEASMFMQLDNFYNQYVRWTGDETSNAPASWTEAFDLLTNYLLKFKRRKRIVVFIDELPWLDTPRAGFVSALEYFWNQHGSQMNNLILVGCGSAASWIRKKLLKAKGGLYNRVTQRIELQPFSLRETEEYFLTRKIRFTRYQILQLYMAMGGIPFYLKEVKTGLSVDQIIDALCFTPSGMLSNEYDQLYHSLFKNAEDHIAIVEGLAAKPQGLIRADLLAASTLPDGGTFTRTLNELIDCGFITSYQPFAKKKKDTIYRLIDMYTLFYLKFIRFNTSHRPNIWQSLKSTSGFTPWSGYAFENIALLHIDQIHHALQIGGIHTKVSSWKFGGDKASSGSQIDLIIDRPDDIIHLCEAKFTRKEFRIDNSYNKKLRARRGIFEYATRTKKLVVNTLITTYPAHRNAYYHEEIHSEVNMDQLFG